MKITINKNILAFYFFVLSFFILIGIIALNREFFTTGTETDYLGGFIPEAKRFMNSEPLLLEFQPPLYAIFIGVLKRLSLDWLTVGLLVSFLSSVITLIASFLFFYHLLGRYAAFGAIVGLVTNYNFILYSVIASTDVPFLALFYAALLSSLLGIKKQSLIAWGICGFIVGCAVLTRTNGITLLILITFVWPTNSRFIWRLKNFLSFLFGLLAPVTSWIFFAIVSGSEFKPTGTYLNLALTYFPPSSDRITGDARYQIEEKFNSIFDVISYDPFKILRIYIKDAIFLVYDHLPSLMHPFLFSFVVAGIFIFIVSKSKEKKLLLFMYLSIFITQAALINFKAFEPRYYLFFIPIFGAFMGESLQVLFHALDTKKSRKVFISFFCVICISLLTSASFNAWEYTHGSDYYLREFISKIQNFKFNESDIIISRKPIIPFYANCNSGYFPNVKNIDQLKDSLKNTHQNSEVFLFYGPSEKSLRGKLSELADPDHPPDWLKVLAKSKRPGTWVFYSVLKESV